MRSLLIIPLRVAVSVLVGWLCVGHSVLHAQNTNLKNCSETLHKTRQAITESRSPNQQALFPMLYPAYQKLQQTYTNWAECVKGQKAPLSSIKTLNGEVYDTTSLAGKIVLVNFWFMSCAPCRAEFPAFNKLVEEYKGKNVLFLGFSTDRMDRLKSAFFEQNPFTFKIVPEAQPIANSFYIMGYPTTYIIDQKGIIRQAWIGFMEMETDKLASYYKAKSAIERLLTTNSK